MSNEFQWLVDIVAELIDDVDVLGATLISNSEWADVQRVEPKGVG